MATKRDVRLLFGVPKVLWVNRMVNSKGPKSMKYSKLSRVIKFIGDDKVVIRPGGHKQDEIVPIDQISPCWSQNPDLREAKKLLMKVREFDPMGVDDEIDRITRIGNDGVVQSLDRLLETFNDEKSSQDPESNSEPARPKPTCQETTNPEPAAESHKPTAQEPKPETYQMTTQPISTTKITVSLDLSDDQAIAALQEYRAAAAVLAEKKLAYERAIEDEKAAREIASSHGITFADQSDHPKASARSSGSRSQVTDQIYRLITDVSYGTQFSSHWIAATMAERHGYDQSQIKSSIYSFVKTDRFLDLCRVVKNGRKISFIRKHPTL